MTNLMMKMNHHQGVNELPVANAIGAANVLSAANVLTAANVQDESKAGAETFKDYLSKEG
jgi:hypothetical protein